ncbi:major histocompatibility complex class I-related gene protein-like [Clarias gariepinus]
MWRCRAVMKALIFLTFSFHLSSAVTHSMQKFYTWVTPGINVPEFTTFTLVDGDLCDYYDSIIRRSIPKTEWILKVNDEYPHFWNFVTQNCQSLQEIFKAGLEIIKKNCNQTTGVHTLQLMLGCEIDDDDGTTRGYMQLGYDRESFMTFELETKTWISAKPRDVINKHIWDYVNGLTAEYQRNYVSTTCIKWLKEFVSYSRKTLERKVVPEVSVFQKQSPYPEVVCHATGFFPKAVMITWHKDREDVHEDVELRETLPNQDGSFQKRSILRVPAEELQKHTYTCVVQHSSLEKELVREAPKGPNKLEL